jgi:protein-tyrosine phosphatase
MRVLFVCTGNICRSPTAEGVFRSLVAAAGLAPAIEVDSAGTHDYHRGAPPDPRACRVALTRGYDLSGLRARPVGAADFRHFDLILAMDRGHLAWLQRRRPADARARLSMFLGNGADSASAEVPDPYYGGEADFVRVLDLVEAGARGLLTRLEAERRV